MKSCGSYKTKQNKTKQKKKKKKKKQEENLINLFFKDKGSQKKRFNRRSDKHKITRKLIMVL